jgi:hypothetical protein
MNAPSEPSPPLNPDDPRLSEWIDGRLSPPEAAAVERAVNRSPELARLVADLRAVKAAARQATAASPPPGFADRVMAAVAAERAVHDGGGSDPSDRLVEAEWQAIEAERIAEERTEAAADLEEEIDPVRAAKRPTWPWLTIATALAAGLLVTVVLNVPRPEPGAVEVALLTDREAEPRDRERALSKPAEDKADGNVLGVGEGQQGQQAGRKQLARTAAEAEQLDAAAQLAEPIEVMVRGPEGQAKLRARLASLGLTVMPSRSKPGGESREMRSRDNGIKSEMAKQGEGQAERANRKASSAGPASDELFELVGPEEAVAAFLAAPLEARPLAMALSTVPGEAGLQAGEAGDGDDDVKREVSRERMAGDSARATEGPTGGLPEEARTAARDGSLGARGGDAPAAATAARGIGGVGAPPAGATLPPAARPAAVAAPVRRILIRVVELPAAAGEPSEP